jgi:hypothetical protein
MTNTECIDDIERRIVNLNLAEQVLQIQKAYLLNTYAHMIEKQDLEEDDVFIQYESDLSTILDPLPDPNADTFSYPISVKKIKK